MVNDILQAAGITRRQARHTSPPAETYAVYYDDKEADGADDVVLLYLHDVTIELYEPNPDDYAEARLESELNARRIKWVKQDRIWLPDRQRYMVVYEFPYIEKLRR